MPRDLSQMVTDSTLEDMHPLTKSPDSVLDRDSPTCNMDDNQGFNPRPFTTKRDELHPYTQTLNLSNVESCVRLEEATFPPHERCTRDKFIYRLRTCGELSLGIFTSEEGGDIPTAETSRPVYSGTPERKAVLLGHIVSTKSTNPTVTDDDMNYPTPPDHNPAFGHKEIGRTICLHSLAVLPEHQHRGLGTTLMKSYIERLESHDVADRVALIAHEHLIPYYEHLGFRSLGPSQAQFGGGGWFDMVRDLYPSRPG